MSIKGNPTARVPDSVPDCQASQYFVTVAAPTMAGAHTVSRLTFRNNPPPTMARAPLGPPCNISLQRNSDRETVLRYRHTGIKQYCHIGILQYWHKTILAYCHIGISHYRHMSLSAYDHMGILRYWHMGIQYYRHTTISAYHTIGIWVYAHIGIKPYRYIILSAYDDRSIQR